MRQWRRVPAATMCGFCVNRIIKKGESALYRSLPGVKRERVRCQDCAGEAPPELPPMRDYATNEKEIGDFAALQQAMPKRTRGELKSFTERNWYETERE